MSGDYTTVGASSSARYAANVPLGSTLELMVTNQTGAHHPFHLHGFSIQPLDLTGRVADLRFNERDNTTFPTDIRCGRGGSIVRVDDGRYDAGRLAGRWVVHCHNFLSRRSGMIRSSTPYPDGNERRDQCRHDLV